MSPNPLIKFIGKPSFEFTRSDIIKYIEHNNVEMVNFRYVAGDGRLKVLNFIINSKKHLETILTKGERVDGSSLFPYVETGSSDLYVVPRFNTAFVNPFSQEPTIDFLCSYFNKDGYPLENSPENVLRKAHKVLFENTGHTFEAMGELEYYVISDKSSLFTNADQKGYHESFPFNKKEAFRIDAMKTIAKAGGYIKYGHSEVGNFIFNDKVYEQNEIEFLPVTLEDAADQLVIAKWILRALAYKYGVNITFAPKITLGKAGSGLHIHTQFKKNGKSVMLNNGKLSDTAKKIIAGYLYLTPSLTAFGNTNPTSYFRLIPNQEAPTKICWGHRNRSALVRIPLAWLDNAINMMKLANPKEVAFTSGDDNKDYQTIEYRCSDGSADVYLLLAGLAVAARYGLEMEDALEYAEKTYVEKNIFKDENLAKQLPTLPTSCWESAEMLEKQKDIYLKCNVFTENLIQGTINKLKSYGDKNLIKDNEEAIIELINKYFYCG